MKNFFLCVALLFCGFSLGALGQKECPVVQKVFGQNCCGEVCPFFKSLKHCRCCGCVHCGECGEGKCPCCTHHKHGKCCCSCCKCGCNEGKPCCGDDGCCKKK